MTDTQRIDWLEQNKAKVHWAKPVGNRSWRCEHQDPQAGIGLAVSLRDAIDKAILQDQIDLAHEEGKLHMEMELKKQLDELSTRWEDFLASPVTIANPTHKPWTT